MRAIQIVGIWNALLPRSYVNFGQHLKYIYFIVFEFVFQYNFKDARKVSGISTQGRADANQWVLTYMVVYQTTNSNWTTVKDDSGSAAVQFELFNILYASVLHDIHTCSSWF